MTESSRTGQVTDVEHFWGLLEPIQQEVLRRAGRWHAHPAGSVLIREGDAAESVLVLLSGRVKVVAVGRSGHQTLLAIRVPGDILGELAAVDDRHRSATVIAADAVEVLRIPVPAFVEILRAHGAISYSLLRVVSTKLRSANARRVETGETTIAQRVSTTLAELAADHGTIVAGEITIMIPLSQEELAMMVGASREAVVRALRELRATGLIRTARRQITLLRPDLLSRPHTD